MEAPVARLYRNFYGSLCDFLVGGPSSRKKHLENFSKILSLKCLVTCLGDLFATWFSCEKCMSCALRTVFPRTFLIVHCHVRTTFSQTHHVLLKNPLFSSFSQLQSSRKGMGFSSFSKYFMFIALDFLIFELMLSFEKLEFQILVWVYLTEFVKCILLTLRIWYLIYMFLCMLFIFE